MFDKSCRQIEVPSNLTSDNREHDCIQQDKRAVEQSLSITSKVLNLKLYKRKNVIKNNKNNHFEHGT